MSRKKNPNTVRDYTQLDMRYAIQFDYEKAAVLARIGCTDGEIAAELGISVDTYRLRRQKDPNFARMINQSRASGYISLRKLQWRSAKRGSVKMQVWLGKQLLQQRERSEVTVSAGNGPWGELDLTKLTDDELTLLQSLMLKARRSEDPYAAKMIPAHSSSSLFEPTEIVPPETLEFTPESKCLPMSTAPVPFLGQDYLEIRAIKDNPTESLLTKEDADLAQEAYLQFVQPNEDAVDNFVFDGKPYEQAYILPTPNKPGEGPLDSERAREISHAGIKKRKEAQAKIREQLKKQAEEAKALRARNKLARGCKSTRPK